MISKLLKTIDRLNFYQISLLLFITFSLTIVMLLTTLTRSQIKVKPGSAYFETTFATKESFTPQLLPEIYGVKPYLGKLGDEVVIWGNNFGKNPKGGYIKIGNTEGRVIKWLNNEIRFETPEATSGLISISNGTGVISYEKPFIVYNANDASEVIFDKENDKVIVKNAPPNSILNLWYKNGTKSDHKIIEKMQEINLKVTSDINWITLLDNQSGSPLPFKQDPAELKFISW